MMSRARSIALWLFSGPLALACVTLIATQSPGAPLMVLLSMVLGPIVGLSTTGPYFTWQFKLGLGFALFCAALLIFAGVQFFDRRFGRPMLLLGGIIWTVAGGLGFGPQ
jgi:hypothetical protein